MKAAVLHGREDLRVEEIERPSPGPGEVLVRVLAAGVCSSDFTRFRSANVRRLPLVLGHEFAGEVEEAGERAEAQPGSRVAVYPLLWCGRCESCRQGAYQRCSDYSYHGSRTDGGLAEYVVTRSSNLVALPDGVSAEEGAMTEPVAVAFHALSRAGDQAGRRVAIVGAGAIGLIAAQIARAQGAASVVVLDILDVKLDMARRLGFEAVVRSDTGGVAERVAELGGGSPETVLEAAGSPVSYRLALGLVGAGGSVVFMGNISGDLLLPQDDVSSLLRRELRLLGTWNSTIAPPRNEWAEVLEMVRSGALTLAPLISHRLALDELPGAMKQISERREAAWKVMVKFGD